MSRDRDYHGISRRRAIKITGGTAIGAALAGCSGDGDDPAGASGDGGDGGDGDGGDGGDGEDTPQQDTTPDSGETEIRFWAGIGGQNLQTLQDMADQYNESQDGIHVSVTSQGSYTETLNATVSAVNAGDPPAVAQINAINTRLVLDTGAFEPISEVLPEVDFDGFIDAARNYYSIEGEPQSMPFNTSTPVMYYNMDLFEEAGIEPNFEPTWDDIRQWSEELTDQGVCDYGCTWPNHSWFMEQWFAEADELFVNEGNGREGRPDTIHLDKDIGIDAYSWQNDLYQDDLYFNPGIQAWGEARQSFVNQQSAMMIISTAGVNRVTTGAQEAEDPFEVRTSYIPVRDERTGVIIGGGSLWTPSNIPEEKRAAAAEFIQWMVEPEQQAAWHKNTGYFPVREDAVAQLEDEGWFEENPNYRVAFDQLLDTEATQATAGPVIGPFNNMRETVEEALVGMFQGNAVEDEVMSAKQDIESEMESYQERN